MPGRTGVSLFPVKKYGLSDRLVCPGYPLSEANTEEQIRGKNAAGGLLDTIPQLSVVTGL